MNKLTRRRFLGTAAVGSVAMTRLARGAAATRQLKLGLIGCGWYGMVDVKAALKAGGVEVIALCDIDSEHLKNSAGEVEKLQGSRPKTFKHYKEMLDTPGLEAVIIATPPHWHALPFIAACEKGLDVYQEKPVAYDIREGRAMIEAQRKAGNVVQVGFQRRQSEGFGQARDYIRKGNAGRLVQIEAQIHYSADPGDTTPQDPPASLDWDLWCGPGPKLPYKPSIGHFKWRLEAAYGNGHLVDWGIHLIDAIRWTIDEATPMTIQAAGGIYHLKNKITTPDVLTVHYEFVQCPVTWRHHIWGAAEYDPEVANGVFFLCEKETVFASDNKWIVIPKGKGKEHKVNVVRTDPGAGIRHMANFLDAVRTRKPPACTIEDGCLSTATVQLGMIAYHAGAKIAWDRRGEQIENNPSAAKLLMREYRKPYEHPYKG